MLRSEQAGDLAVLVHVDLLGGGNLGQARHGSPPNVPFGGGPDFLSSAEVNSACGKGDGKTVPLVLYAPLGARPAEQGVMTMPV